MLRKLNIDAFSNVDECTFEEFQEFIKAHRCEVYTEDSINAFKGRLRELIVKGEEGVISSEELEIIEKANKDMSQLTKKVIVDKNGKRTTVWVRASGEQETEHEAHGRVMAVLDNPSMKKSDKVRNLYSMGISDKGALAAITGANYSQVHSIIKKHEETGSETTVQRQRGQGGEGRQQMTTDQTNEMLNNLKQSGKLPPIPVEEMWEDYEDSARLVISPDSPAKSLICYGRGGVGKTYTVTKQLENAGLREYIVGEEGISQQNFDQYDYVSITGKATPTAVWAALFQHNGKLIIFDDCDSALQHPDSQNILKGALDTSGDGTVSYRETKIPGTEDKTPARFKFTGKVIFISNVKAENMDQALKSRALTLDMTMTKDQTIERMESLLPKLSYKDRSTGRSYPLSMEGKEATIRLLKEKKDLIDDDHFNTRTILKLALTYDDVKREGKSVERWERRAMHLLG